MPADPLTSDRTAALELADQVLQATESVGSCVLDADRASLLANALKQAEGELARLRRPPAVDGLDLDGILASARRSLAAHPEAPEPFAPATVIALVELLQAAVRERDAARAEAAKWHRAGCDGIDNMAEALGRAQQERDAADRAASSYERQLLEVQTAYGDAAEMLVEVAVDRDRWQARAESVLADATREIDQLESDIDEHLPEYRLDDGTGDEANGRERIEYAGTEIRRLRAERDRLSSKVAGRLRAIRSMGRRLCLERWQRIKAEAAVAALTERRDALLVTVRNVSQSTPLPAEIEGWEGQRAALVAEAGTLRARVAELERDRVATLAYVATFSPFTRRAADALADEVAVLVRRKIIDSRSPAADALLDYRNPPSTERADRMAKLEAERDALTRQLEESGREHDATIAMLARAGALLDRTNRGLVQFADELEAAADTATPAQLRQLARGMPAVLARAPRMPADDRIATIATALEVIASDPRAALVAGGAARDRGGAAGDGSGGTRVVTERGYGVDMKCKHPHTACEYTANLGADAGSYPWKRIYCTRCRDYLAIGLANDTPQVLVEVRVAFLVASYKPVGGVRDEITEEERAGWREHDAPQTDAYLAGWLAGFILNGHDLERLDEIRLLAEQAIATEHPCCRGVGGHEAWCLAGQAASEAGHTEGA